MTVAVSKAVEDGRARDRLRLDREHGRVGGGLRRTRRADGGRSCSRGGAVALGKLAQARAAGARVLEVRGQLRRGASRGARARRTRGARRSSTRSTRTGSKDRRPRRSRSSRSSAGRPTCSRSPTAAAATRRVREGLRGGWVPGAADRRRRGGRPRDDGALARSASRRPCTAPRSTRRSRARAAQSSRVTDDEICTAWRALARDEGSSASPRPRRASRRSTHRLEPGRASSASHRPRPQGSGPSSARPAVVGDPTRTRSPTPCRDRPRARDDREPRPGFDCAGAALDLWNELEVDARA